MAKGGIIRVQKRECPFVQIDKGLIEDERMSWKAKGMLIYLLSKPDGWTVQPNDLAKKSTDGEYAVYSGLNELISCGYITRKKEINEVTKQFAGIIYTVYEIPLIIDEKDTASPYVENHDADQKPYRGFPHMGFPDMENHDISNKELSNNNFRDKPKEEKEGLEIDHDDIPVKTKNEPDDYVLSIKLWEQEIGQAISRKEEDIIRLWMVDKKYTFDLFQEAVDRMALQGIRNRPISYIDGIFREWDRAKITTLVAAKVAYENRKEQQRQEKEKPWEKQPTKQLVSKTDPNKYDNFYL